MRRVPTELPVTFDRPLRLFTYIVGHSQVLFRGERDTDAGLTTTLEILFADVGSLSVRDHYRSLTVRTASGPEGERLRAADPRRWHDRRAFVLEAESGGDGHVVAGTMTWAELPGPAGYSSFLLPGYDLPAFLPDRPPPAGPDTVHTAWLPPRRQP